MSRITEFWRSAIKCSLPRERASFLARLSLEFAVGAVLSAGGACLFSLLDLPSARDEFSVYGAGCALAAVMLGRLSRKSAVGPYPPRWQSDPARLGLVAGSVSLLTLALLYIPLPSFERCSALVILGAVLLFFWSFPDRFRGSVASLAVLAVTVFLCFGVAGWRFPEPRWKTAFGVGIAGVAVLAYLPGRMLFRPSRLPKQCLILAAAVYVVVIMLVAWGWANFHSIRQRETTRRTRSALRGIPSSLETYYIDNNEYPYTGAASNDEEP